MPVKQDLETHSNLNIARHDASNVGPRFIAALTMQLRAGARPSIQR